MKREGGDGRDEVLLQVWFMVGVTLPYQKIQKFPWRARKNRYVLFAAGSPHGGIRCADGGRIDNAFGEASTAPPWSELATWIFYEAELLHTHSLQVIFRNGFRRSIRSPWRPNRSFAHSVTSQEAFAAWPWLATCPSK